VGFTEDLIKVGQQMDQAKRAYSDAMGKLSEGPGNLVRQVELLKQLGARTNKGVNEKLLQRALDDQGNA
jgi:DNA recombination protein RmuC